MMPPSHLSLGVVAWRRYERQGERETGRATVFAACPHGRGPVASTDAALARLCEDRRVRPTVLIVDDHAEFRASAAELLEAEGFDVVGAAGDAARAVELTVRLRPQIVLLDVQLPDEDGFAVAARLAEEARPPRVVLISGRDAASYGRRVAGAPVCGFIAKRELTGAAVAALVT
jgi:CheY-like chemotaxis protein